MLSVVRSASSDFFFFFFSSHIFHTFSMSGSEYFTNRKSFNPHYNSVNKCHYPHFTDKKTEAQRSEMTFAGADGWQMAGKGLEPGQCGSSLSPCPLRKTAHCFRKHFTAVKEISHAGL